MLLFISFLWMRELQQESLGDILKDIKLVIEVARISGRDHSVSELKFITITVRLKL